MAYPIVYICGKAYGFSMNTTTVLVVDDDQQVADVVVYILEKYGYQVVLASDGLMGLQVFRSANPALVVLDLNLPHMSGQDLFKAMRQERPGIPVIMLTCQSDDIDRIIGLELGADDYVTKPFNAQELLARVKAVLRRCQQSPSMANSKVLEEGPFWMDTKSYVFRFYGDDVDLTRQEFAIMEAFVSAPARVFERDVLIARMYADQNPVTDRSVDSCIKRIRQKLSRMHAGENPIRTVYGIGYKLNEKLLA